MTCLVRLIDWSDVEKAWNGERYSSCCHALLLAFFCYRPASSTKVISIRACQRSSLMGISFCFDYASSKFDSGGCCFADRIRAEDDILNCFARSPHAPVVVARPISWRHLLRPPVARVLYCTPLHIIIRDDHGENIRSDMRKRKYCSIIIGDGSRMASRSSCFPLERCIACCYYRKDINQVPCWNFAFVTYE